MSNHEMTDWEMNEYTPWLEKGITELEYFRLRYLEVSTENERLEKQNKILYEALSATRGQWIHSVNKDQCLEALNEFDGHIHVMPSNGKHKESKQCWCNPELFFKDIDGKEVWTHRSDEETKQ